MSVLDNVKEVVSLVQKVDNIDLYRQIQPAAAAGEDGWPIDQARPLFTGCCWPRVI